MNILAVNWQDLENPHAGGAEVWPDPGDFPSTSHRAILQQLLAGPAWAAVATAIYRVHEALGSTVAETLERMQALDEANERLTPEDISRELEVSLRAMSGMRT